MSQDLIAAFLAKGGAIKKLDESATNGMTRKDWYKAERGIDNAGRRNDTPLLAVVDHCGRSWYKNSDGEVLGHD